MQKRVQDILKKINYIEVEAEIQKQILQSIPKNQQTEIEEIIKKIARAKEQTEQLRSELKAVSPREFEKLLAIEKATEEFRKLAHQKNFTSIESLSTHPACTITYQTGESQPCLVKARDEENNWTIITLDGELKHIGGADVSTDND